MPDGMDEFVVQIPLNSQLLLKMSADSCTESTKANPNRGHKEFEHDNR